MWLISIRCSGVTETVGAPRDFATRGPPSKSICKRYDRHTRKPCPVLTCSKWVQTKIKQLQWFTVNIWVAQASSVARVNQWGREENVGVWRRSPQKNFEDTLCTLAQNTSPEDSPEDSPESISTFEKISLTIAQKTNFYLMFTVPLWPFC